MSIIPQLSEITKEVNTIVQHMYNAYNDTINLPLTIESINFFRDTIFMLDKSLEDEHNKAIAITPSNRNEYISLFNFMTWFEKQKSIGYTLLNQVQGVSSKQLLSFYKGNLK